MTLRSFILVALLSTTACHPPITIVTPAGKAAFVADRVLQRIEELEKAAIAANAANVLDIKTTRLIVVFARDAAQTLKAVPQGWQATLVTAWRQAKTALPASMTPTVQTAVSLVDTVIATLVGG